jgi:hypothetical protein
VHPSSRKDDRGYAEQARHTMSDMVPFQADRAGARLIFSNLFTQVR